MNRNSQACRAMLAGRPVRPDSTFWQSGGCMETHHSPLTAPRHPHHHHWCACQPGDLCTLRLAVPPWPSCAAMLLVQTERHSRRQQQRMRTKTGLAQVVSTVRIAPPVKNAGTA